MTIPLSTFEREMQDAEFCQQFDNAYKEFLLSEIVLASIECDNKTVRALAKEVNLSPTVVHK